MTSKNQLIQLFPKGQHIALLTINKKPNYIQRKILKKFMHTLSNNEQLQNEFNEILKNPELIYSTKSLGLSKNELEVLLSIFTKRETTTEQDTASITSTGEHITFKGSGRLSILDSLVINTRDTSSLYKQQPLDYYKPDSSYFPNEFFPTGEHLENAFAFSGPNGLSGLLPMSNKYVLIVGRLSKSGKTYLYLETQEQFDINTPVRPFYSIILY